MGRRSYVSLLLVVAAAGLCGYAILTKTGVEQNEVTAPVHARGTVLKDRRALLNGCVVKAACSNDAMASSLPELHSSPPERDASISCPNTPSQNPPEETNHQSAAYLADLASVKLRHGMRQDGVRLLRNALATTEDDVERLRYRIALAQELESQGDFAKALEYWTQIAESDDPAAMGRAGIHIAAHLVRQGQTERAIGMLENVVHECPLMLFKSEAARRLTGLLMAADQSAERIEDYARKFRADPQSPELRKILLALQTGDRTARLETYQKAMAARPCDIDLLSEYGEELIRAGMLEEAHTHYVMMAADYPSRKQVALIKLAHIAVLIGDASEIARYVREAASHIPDGSRKSLYLARKFLELEQWEDAAVCAQEALDTSTGQAFRVAAATEYGTALARLGRFSEARKVLQPVAEQKLWQGLRVRAAELLSEMGDR